MTSRRAIPVISRAAACCAVATAAVWAPATAAAASPVTPATDGPYCAVDIDARGQEKDCFGSPQEVTAHISAQNEYALVTVHDWIGLNHSGPWTTYFGPRPCSSTTSDVDFRVSSLYDVYFTAPSDDRVTENDAYSSVVTYNQCDIKLSDWVNNNPDGDQSGWIHSCTNLNGSGQGDCPTVQSWYDRASSFLLS